MKKINFQFPISNFRFLILNLFVVYYLSFGMFGVASAEMRSNSYVIFENVNQTFDGPVISNVSSSVSSEKVTVTWNTDVPSDSFVIYDTDNSFANSGEQGTSVKTFTNHSVVLSGLAEGATYYYKVRSSRVNGGVTTDNTVRSFTTGAKAVVKDKTSNGGMLIIDKTDKVAPVVSNITIGSITSNSAEISWKTDEDATSFVEYGTTAAYGSTYGTWDSTKDHSVKLINLEPSSKYYFRVVSSDGSGNVTHSPEQSLTTINAAEDVATSTKPEEKKPDTSLKDENNRLRAALNSLRNFFGRLFPAVSLNSLDNNMNNINSLADLNGFAPVPVLSGEPRVQVDANGAKVFWTTDINANSLVAVAPVDAYKPGNGEPYLQIVGNSEEQTKDHEVNLYGLLPNTEYHFQLRSKATVGNMSKSKDFTFRTKMETLVISSFLSKVINDQTAVFKWVTNKESDSVINFAPYKGNVPALDELKVVRDNALSTIHEIQIPDFEAGVIYSVELVSTDGNGNTVKETIDRFSTSEKDVPPLISHIKADSTIFVDKTNKIQTVISWVTNEPSTSQVYYQEGVHGGQEKLESETLFSADYTKEHVVVISKFKSGVVYSFRVESIDSGGNISTSKINTFMTAKKKDSIIQIIINILENTFGWVKKMM